MKKLYMLLFLVIAASISNAQIINFPDANFKAKLLEASTSNSIAKDLNGYNMKIDTNSDGEIQNSEAILVGTLSVSSASIASLEGIAGFTSLFKLYCPYNQLTSLDLSAQPNLSELRCDNNQITSLNISTLHSLSIVYCNNNQIASLNLSGCTSLGSLICSDNIINSITFSTSGSSFWYFDCKNNQLTALLLTAFNYLRFLYCGNNQLYSLASNSPYMEELRCENNQLPTLNTVNMQNLQILDCSANLLTHLDISRNRGVNYLKCSNNHLETLNLKNGRTAIATQLFNGNPGLQYICCDDFRITSTLSAAFQNGYPNGSVEVNSYCSLAPGGYVYGVQPNPKYDSNSNGCDASDVTFPNLKLLVTLGSTSFYHVSNPLSTNIISLIAGTYTFAPILENPTYFTITPATVNVTLPGAANPFIQNFCLTPNGTHQDIESWIVPIRSPRPGFNCDYKIMYRNKGSVTVSGYLNFSFDDDYMDFVSATPLVNNQAYSLLTWNYTNLLPFETREILVRINMNTPLESLPLNTGDLIKFESTVYPLSGDEYQTDNSNYLRQIVANSHDPNDKTCVEGLVIAPDTVGDYVHYVIRFENTGTANAQNIVVKDIIDTTKYEISSLIPLSGSAPFATRIVNTNQVEFYFENINLPFDDENNDGYIAFKIKTKPTLVVGNTFSNTANIYFDYNFPIVTNTFTTLISALGTPDFDFGTMFSLYPVPAKNVLTITNKQNAIISSASIYNTLGQLIQVTTGPNGTIDVSGLKAGNYFIKIASDRGTASSKFIKE